MGKVSVIVSVYNAGGYLQNCLESLVSQTLENIEIILVNDGSTDRSLEIMEQFREQYPEVMKCISQERQGISQARNAGLSLAEGEYIGFVDADDYVDVSMFEKMYHLAQAEEADIVTCGYYYVTPDQRQERETGKNNAFGQSVMKAPALFTSTCPRVWNKLFKKEMLQKYNFSFVPLKQYEDYVFTYKAFLKAGKIVRVPEALYHHQVRKEAETGFLNKKSFDLFAAHDHLLQYFKEEGAYCHFEEELLYLLLNQIYLNFSKKTKITAGLLKFSFINKSFQYLNRIAPYWKDANLYFEKRKKNGRRYGSLCYWYLKSLFPATLKSIITDIKQLKKRVVYSHAGAQYAEFLKEKPIDGNRMLILSQQGNNLNGNLFYLLKELCTNRDYEQYKIGLVYAADKKEDFKELLTSYGLNKSNVKLIKIHSKEYTEYLATAKYLMNDTSFSVYFMKREGQIYLNTWHGTPLKTLGKGTAEEYFDIANVQKNFLSSDYLLYPSEYMREHMFRDYMLTPLFKNKVLMAGYPRNEIFFDQESYEAIRKENELSDKTCIAYMPTYRGNVRAGKDAQKKEIMTYLEEIDAKLTENQILFVNLHPFLANDLSYDVFEHVRPFPKKYETYDFLNACDILITDYSSVLFDYAVTKRKVILFAYDEQEYFESRGVYIGLDELPFEKVETTEQLMEAVNSLEIRDYTEFFETFAAYEAADISAKICKTVIGGKDSGLLCQDYSDHGMETVLLHVDSLAGNAVPYMRKVSAGIQKQEGLCACYTYDTDIVKPRKHIMKRLPEELIYWGRLKPFSMMSKKEAVSLYFAKRYSICAHLFDGRLQEIYQKETVRSFGNTQFKAHIVVGRETAEMIGFVSCQQGRKILCLTQDEDYNAVVPAKVYNRYDMILVHDMALERKLRSKGITTEVRDTKLENITSVL